jgi:hypothetical protein
MDGKKTCLQGRLTLDFLPCFLHLAISSLVCRHWHPEHTNHEDRKDHEGLAVIIFSCVTSFCRETGSREESRPEGPKARSPGREPGVREWSRRSPEGATLNTISGMFCAAPSMGASLSSSFFPRGRGGCAPTWSQGSWGRSPQGNGSKYLNYPKASRQTPQDPVLNLSISCLPFVPVCSHL